MDRNHLYRRRQISLFMAEDESSAASGQRATWSDPADERREQAASFRRLAGRARTTNGAFALKMVAEQFDDDARRIDPFSERR